jgi:hypothetical protein
MALAGPIAAAIGVDQTLWLGVAVFLAATAIIAAIPSVRTIRAPTGEAHVVPTIPAA